MKKILLLSLFIFLSAAFLGSFLLKKTAYADNPQTEIINKYKKLFDENQKKHEEIIGKPYSPDRELQLEANLEYQEFLLSKQNYEICKLDPKKSCVKEEKEMLEIGSKVRKIMSELTHLEQARNKNMTFNVSKYYSLPGQQQGTRSFLQVTNMIADWMIMLVGSVAVTVLIIGGLVLLFAGTNETYKEYGKFAVTHSFIGILLVLLAYAIIAFLQSLFY